MRKRSHVAHENHERWLVSYADFITLLFAFFVVMFASSHRDKDRAKQVSDSVRQALAQGSFIAVVQTVMSGERAGEIASSQRAEAPSRNPQAPAVDPSVVELLPSLEYLSRQLSAEIRSGKLQVRLTSRGLVISLQQAAFFPSGEDTIDPSTYPAVEKIARTLQALPNPVRLEGHTDSIPIHTARFRSNWVLSVARGVAMLELLTQRYRIPEERLAVAGYGATAPVTSNQSAEGRSRNRRVDIVILNQRGLASEPIGSSDPSERPVFEPKASGVPTAGS